MGILFNSYISKEVKRIVEKIPINNSTAFSEIFSQIVTEETRIALNIFLLGFIRPTFFMKTAVLGRYYRMVKWKPLLMIVYIYLLENSVPKRKFRYTEKLFSTMERLS